ncbi:MAG: DnaB-like helicase N-terminal domain-containing protein [Gaiella sp.]
MQDTASIGRDLPFYDLDLERSVLGCVLRASCDSPDSGWAVLDELLELGVDSASFFVRTHGALFSELVAIRLAGIALDPLTLAYALEERIVARVGPLGEMVHVDVAGIRALLAGLGAETNATTLAPHHARVLLRLAAQRKAGER